MNPNRDHRKSYYNIKIKKNWLEIKKKSYYIVISETFVCMWSENKTLESKFLAPRVSPWSLSFKTVLRNILT